MQGGGEMAGCCEEGEVGFDAGEEVRNVEVDGGTGRREGSHVECGRGRSDVPVSQGTIETTTTTTTGQR